MANEDRDEALRRIEKARETGATILDLSKLKIDTLPPKIADLTNLHSLDLHDTQVADLSHVAGLTNLQTLFLGNTQVADLSPIAGLTNLQRLSLGNTQVTDLSHIADLTNLHLLDLDNTQVADLSPIAGLTNLQLLSLNNTQVTDLSHIADLTNLQRLDLDNTQVTDLSHIAGLTNLQTLALDTTQVTDLSHVAGLTNLKWLNLDNTQVTDLRFLLDLPRLTHPDVPEDGRGVYFSYTPACNDPAIAAAAEIEDNEDRLQALLAHLRTLPPWPEPLPAHIGASSASGPVPEAPDAPPFPVLRLTHDHRIDLPHLDTPTGIDPAILERLYDRLRRDVDKLSRYANRYEGLSEIVPSLNRSLGNEFDSMDAVNLHLDLSELFDLRGAEPDGIDPWEADARSAADIVLRSGPGLTVSHPEVEAHEKLLTTFARRTSPPTTRAEEIIVQDLSENPAIATESTRSFGKRLAVSTSGGRVADTRQAFARKVILMLVLVGEGLSAAVEGAVYGEALKAAQPAAEFLWLHRNEVMAIAQDWGGQAARWADYVLRQARDIVDRAKDEPL